MKRPMLDLAWERVGDAPSQLSVLMPVHRTPAYVADAVRSVLVQDGCVLDILISDDCSGDATFAAALAEAKTHAGPHSIRVFRTRRRLAMDHLRALIAEARCDFLVEAHGDDLSPPGRMARLLAIHEETGAALVTSLAIDLREGAQTVQLMPDGLAGGMQSDQVVVEPHPEIFQGARYGFHRKIHDDFPPLTSRYLPRGHDVLQAFRAQLTGGIYLSDEPLLVRRHHPAQWSRRLWDTRTPPAARFGYALSRLGILAVMRTDLAHLKATDPDNPHLEGLSVLIDAQEREMLARLLAARHKLRIYGYEPQWRHLDEIGAANVTKLPWPPRKRAGRSWLRRFVERLRRFVLRD